MRIFEFLLSLCISETVYKLFIQNSNLNQIIFYYPNLGAVAFFTLSFQCFRHILDFIILLFFNNPAIYTFLAEHNLHVFIPVT
jgi:hypothetical protein